MLKYFLPSGPIFPVLGNHDSNPEAIDSPHSLPGVLGQQQSWNYEHVAGLWQQNGWISSSAASEARMHYAAYSINHPSKSSSGFAYKNNMNDVVILSKTPGDCRRGRLSCSLS
jgi:hypothetical protein